MIDKNYQNQIEEELAKINNEEFRNEIISSFEYFGGDGSEFSEIESRKMAEIIEARMEKFGIENDNLRNIIAKIKGENQYDDLIISMDFEKEISEVHPENRMIEFDNFMEDLINHYREDPAHFMEEYCEFNWQ